MQVARGGASLGLMKNEDGRRDAGGWRPPGFEEGRRPGGGDPRGLGEGLSGEGGLPGEEGLQAREGRTAGRRVSGLKTLGSRLGAWRSGWPAGRGPRTGDKPGGGGSGTGLRCPHQELCLPA